MPSPRIPPAPVRTPMYDRQGVLSREWLIWLHQVATAAARVADLDALEPLVDTAADVEGAVAERVELSREATGREISGEIAEAIELARDGGRGIDQDAPVEASGAVESLRGELEELRRLMEVSDRSRAGGDAMALLALLESGTPPAGGLVLLAGPLSDLPAGLGASDAGLLYLVTDYRHTLRWTGSAWSWGPGEDGAHPIVALPFDPGVGWALCDGSMTTYLNADGTTTAWQTPALTLVPAFLKLGAAYSAGVVAEIPGAVTGATSVDPGHSHSGTTGAGTANETFPQGSGTAVTVSNDNHAHMFNTDWGGSHSHSVAGNSSGGEPQKIVMLPYFRR